MAHMQDHHHPEIIEERLRKAGMLPR